MTSCELTNRTMIKANPAIFLPSRVHNSRLLGVLSNPRNSTEMLNIDEGIALVINKLNILQLQSVLQIQNVMLKLASF